MRHPFGVVFKVESTTATKKHFTTPSEEGLTSSADGARGVSSDRPRRLTSCLVTIHLDASQKNRVSSGPPGVKADATKRDHRTGSNRPKTARTSGLVQQSVQSGSKKKEVASTECSHIAGRRADVEKGTPVIVDENCRPKDSGRQPNPTAIDVENELPQERDLSSPHKGENDDKQQCSVDLGGVKWDM